MLSSMDSKMEIGSFFAATAKFSSPDRTDSKCSFSDRASLSSDSPSIQSVANSGSIIIAPPNSPCISNTVHLLDNQGDTCSDGSTTRSMKLVRLSRQVHSIFEEQKCLKKPSSLFRQHNLSPDDHERVDQWRHQVLHETSREIKPLPAPRFLGVLFTSFGTTKGQGKTPSDMVKGTEGNTEAVEQRAARKARVRVAPWEVSFNQAAIGEAPKPKFLQKLFN